jgi:manganese-dependent ADP-ribose/CDP-alcohol diphosphatase
MGQIPGRAPGSRSRNKQLDPLQPGAELRRKSILLSIYIMKHSIRKLGLQRYIHVSFLVLLTPLCLAAPFIDTFETDTSEHYTGSDSFGSGGSFTVSTATATLDVNATGENTYLAMLDDGEHFLETGEFVEAVSSIGVGASAPHQYLVVSNTNVQPSVDEGFRFRRSPSLRIWGGTAPGGATTLDDPGNDGGLTYRIERITPTEFRFLYNAGEGFVDLGSYELPDASPRMHVGLQSWAGTTPFDRLIIDTIPTEENVPPTGISLSRDSVRAGSPAGTLVGELTAFDPNPGDTFSFHLVSVDGNSKSSVFEIAQNHRRTLIELNDSATYEVELRVEDSEGLALTKVFSVSVTEQPVIVFGALADVQYSDKPTAGARDYRGSRPRLQSAVDYFNTQSDLDFVISLGDFIDDRWESFDAVVPIWEQLNAPNTYHLLGNHDYVDIGEENIPLVPDRLGMPAPNYTFNVNGSEDNFLFVVLDGQEFATFTTLPGTPERAFADRLRARASSRGSNGFDWNGGLGPIQFSWLRNELDIASREGIQVILFCHYPIFPLGSEHNNHSDHELKALVEQYPVVKVWMNGHQHGGDYASDAGVHFYTMKGMVEQQGSNAYAVCELYEDRLEINGFGSERDRSLEFSDHENGLSPIKEFELSRDGLVITLVQRGGSKW